MKKLVQDQDHVMKKIFPKSVYNLGDLQTFFFFIVGHVDGFEAFGDYAKNGYRQTKFDDYRLA